ncbi:MAG: hypothetical protein K2Z81_12320, partial [Cyanobacteria bacterium]|nr:hypothetical protein [Cyanobacteriota bacterium]
MNRKRVLIISISVLIPLMVLGAALAVLWVHSPIYALQQAGIAIVQKRPEQFYEVVDVEKIVTMLTEEVLYIPALQTPGLSEFQRYVAAGAITISREKIDSALIKKIDSWVSKSTAYGPIESPYNNQITGAVDCDFSRPSNDTVFTTTDQPWLESDEDDPFVDPMEPHIIPVANQGGLDWGGLARTVGKELKTEQEDVKHLVARRMYEYAFAHRNTFVGRVFSSPREERARYMKALVQ